MSKKGYTGGRVGKCDYLTGLGGGGEEVRKAIFSTERKRKK